MKTALVTGCAGFIGSHVAESLINMGFFVHGIDCFTDYYPKAVKILNLKSLIPSDNFEFIESDINTMVSFPEVDYVFHLAAQAGVRQSWGDDFHNYSRQNIEVTQKLLEFYKESSIQKFVYASSSSIYGDVPLPMTETSTPHPISPYGVTKLAAEHLCHLYWKSYGLPTISLRFFTVYGPRQRPDMAISKFLNAIIMKQPITIYGDGNQTRDFTFVSDVVDANILAALKGNPGAVYNVGGGNKISVVNLVKLLGSICDSSPQMIFQPPQRGDAQDTLADTTLIKKDLDWNPKIDIENGLKIFVEWYKCRSY